MLAPWPNRLGDGRYTFGAVRPSCRSTSRSGRNAIHGLVRWMPWRLEAKAQNVVVVSCMFYPEPGYPFTLSLRIQIALAGTGSR